MKVFLRVWLRAIPYPFTSMQELESKPAPFWGLVSILVRFVGTALTSILALAIMNYRPFVPPYLSILPEENYYIYEVFFLPLFGVGAWLLSSGVIHLILRISNRVSRIDWIMNVIGFSLLVVMPVVWLFDWMGIAFSFYGANFTIPLHAGISLWEVGLLAIGFNRMEGVGWFQAIIFGLIVKVGVYIPLAAIFIR